MRDVLFVRVEIQSSVMVTTTLKNLYRAGWHVVSHTESADEYSFVLEGATVGSNTVITGGNAG